MTEPLLVGGVGLVLIDVLSGALIMMGAYFFLAGTVGLLRFPDIYTRLHALTKADALGLGFVVAGLCFRPVDWSTRLQLVTIWVLVLIATATVAHLLARTALAEGIEPVTRRDRESDAG